jgi:two-component system cell cycle response regulator
VSDGGDKDNGGKRSRSSSSGSAAARLDRICSDLCDRGRAVAARARAVAAVHAGPAAAELARALEDDALALAALAEEVLRVRGRTTGRTAGPTPAEAMLGSPEARPRLLLAEDDAEDREALSEALEGDYEISSVGSGDEALEAARELPPDLALLDLHLPGIDGLDVLEALRADPHTSEIQVILISGHADDATRVRALDLGAADFLQKPVSLGELRARIERTLRLSRRHTHLRALAQTDALTGLANLRAFRTRLEDEVRRARRYGNSLTCVMADMDHLKPVNDALGHAAGDRAIAAVADVIRSELRATDLGARYGGDEFVLLLPHTTAGEGRVLAERLCVRLAETALELGGRLIPLRASFGVAELAGTGTADTAGDLVRRADEALYAAKRAGRGRVEIHAGPPRQAPSPEEPLPSRSPSA